MGLPGFASVDVDGNRSRVSAHSPTSLDILMGLKSTMSPAEVTLRSRLVEQDWSHSA